MDIQKLKLAEAYERANNYWIWRHYDYQKWLAEENRFETALDRYLRIKDKSPVE